MKFVADRDTLLRPLQTVQGVVERRHTLPILANVLLSMHDGELAVTATDMEVELVARVALAEAGGRAAEVGETTVPARKFIDICRSLPPEANLSFAVEGDRALVRSGRSRFTLTTLPASDYPSTDSLPEPIELELDRAGVHELLELTHFAMAHQDVRYYLNGLLLELEPGRLRAVATDGHRLALAEMPAERGLEANGEQGGGQIIVPRKAVLELLRLLAGGSGAVKVQVSGNALRAVMPDAQLTTKLIDGRFPEYGRVIPREDQCDKVVCIDREPLRQSLARASILSNEKYRAIRLNFESGRLRIFANNPDQEQAEDELEIEYGGPSLEIGFNVSYLLDALGALPSETACLYLSGPDASCLLKAQDRDDCLYVVMPMRL